MHFYLLYSAGCMTVSCIVCNNENQKQIEKVGWLKFGSSGVVCLRLPHVACASALWALVGCGEVKTALRAELEPTTVMEVRSNGLTEHQLLPRAVDRQGKVLWWKGRSWELKRPYTDTAR